MNKLFFYTKLFYKEIALERIVNTDAGLLWIILPQFVQVFTYFIIFSIGFRTSSISDIPFIVYMLPAFLIWSLFSDTVITSSSLLNQYQYMITKFPLPYFLLILSYYLFSFTIFLFLFSLFLLVSSLFVHYAFSLTTLLYFFVSFINFSIFTFSISLLVSIFSVASKDVRNLVGLFVNSIFWFSPVVYSASLLSDLPYFLRFLLFKIYPVNLLIDSIRSFSSSSVYNQLDIISLPLSFLLSFSIFIISLISYKRTRFFLAEFI